MIVFMPMINVNEDNENLWIDINGYNDITKTLMFYIFIINVAYNKNWFQKLGMEARIILVCLFEATSSISKKSVSLFIYLSNFYQRFI